jgi:DnaJ-class molecular chaperone
MVANHYIALGVSRDADLTKIKRAYRLIVKKCHPDVTQTAEDAERFLEIREAYETLADEEKRQKYDQTIRHSMKACKVAETPRPKPTPGSCPFRM